MNSNGDLDAMAEMTNELEDFGDFLELGDIDLNTLSDSGQYGDQLQQQHSTQSSTSFQDVSGGTSLVGTSAHAFDGQDQFDMAPSMNQQGFIGHHDKVAPASNPFSSESMYHMSMQQAYNPFADNMGSSFQQPYPPSQHIPPTPNSYEMQGQSGRFTQHLSQLDSQRQAMLDQRYQVRKDDATAFTPMVSPAGTPQYNILPEYTTPGAYFSPLSSPMLHAQHQQNVHYRQQHQPTSHFTDINNSSVSFTDPSLDLNVDVQMLDSMTQPESTGPKGRKPRRKIATPKSTGMNGKVKQSPAQNAQKRKSASMTNIVAQNRDDPTERPVTAQPASAGLRLPSQFDSSEADSTSPEPLSESVMGPPPRPDSKNPSPNFVGQNKHLGGAMAGTAATPKSLLTSRGVQQPVNGSQDSTQSSDQVLTGSGGLDDLSLPEAAKPALTPISTQFSPTVTADNTPRISARKTPKLGPLSTPASTRPESATASPMIAASPRTASTPSAILNDKKETKGRRSKKGSMSGSQASPAVVPKVSPSIKPLLPEGTPLNSATQAMLLASKSNYQNILEGNSLPGVTYPDSLHSGLSSKRTSHKVAEQGRRNRINEALKEMQALVPKPASSKSPTKDAEDVDGSPEAGDEAKSPDVNSKETKEDAAVKSNSSKAATVELANDYIRKIQQENETKNADILRLRRENEELKKRLDGQSTSPTERSDDATDNASPSTSTKAE